MGGLPGLRSDGGGSVTEKHTLWTVPPIHDRYEERRMRLTKNVKEWMSIALNLGEDNMNRFDTCFDWIVDEEVVINLIKEHGEREAYYVAEANINSCFDEIRRRLKI